MCSAGAPWRAETRRDETSVYVFRVAAAQHWGSRIRAEAAGGTTVDRLWTGREQAEQLKWTVGLEQWGCPTYSAPLLSSSSSSSPSSSSPSPSPQAHAPVM
ncbi:uncharacterized protein UV8b_08159 [Ustilaginoidea virens]|uniref:Uncharacterized protein n=1 Tax=Ustilaginoidea virens TaxID=1159556 RepID=A0A8E5HZ13_USTVR|nr:uncharacterized protein UV8b_08159 [Ustilaginoidea virens]QUC23918.1 hypothetical protein UV8b_08159 [Ustilaginoidea virens]